MPTYDYVCDACGDTFELMQSFKEPVKKKCEKCKKPKLRRLFGSGGGLVFKGSGFYITDYRSDAYKKSADADKKSSSESSGSSGSESKSSGSSESKPSGGSDKKPSGGEKS